ncbi:MAG TPA: MFS transporter, partial [Hydrogenophaga sp.]|nr:MFS transporter [Hydrogenophaga sp.]
MATGAGGDALTYFREFRINWHILLATFIGISTGNALTHYTLSLFAPELIAEFGWSKAEFALVGTLQVITLLFVPFTGRFADRVGTRVALIIGFITMSLGFFWFSFMSGTLFEFFTIWVVQHVFGMLTTSLVFAKVIVERFDRARGGSLSVLMMGPPLSGALMAPILGAVIAAEGWRAGFVTLGFVTAIGGVICILMMGRKKRDAPKKTLAVRLTREEFMQIVRTRAFLLLVGGMLLINVPQVLAASQIKLLVMDSGITNQMATWMVSFYAIGVLGGRAIFGVALDRFAPHFIALFALSLPAVGYLILASPITVVWIISAGILVIGVAQGAEGDIGAYLVSRHFALKNYSLVLGFVKSGLDAGGALGALILSYTLAITHSYDGFLYVVAASSVLG